ncbi:MAG: YjgP/YjgQ family permease [FCB group bacterium]|nr:YjgP/YjgQ family permease [FCB group bacterium]
MIKKIDFYLLRSFFITLFVVTISIGLIIIVINMVEQLRDFIDHHIAVSLIVQYYLYFGGWVIKNFFPVFVLLSSLFSISLLARKNEILAMKALGLSLYRIALPFLIVALILSAGHFYYNEFIYPPANKKLLEIREFKIKKRSERRYEKVTNIYRQIRPGYFYTLAIFNVKRKEGKDLKVYKTEANRLQEIITAPLVVYKDHLWEAHNGVIRSFEGAEKETYSQFALLKLPDIKDTPEDLAKKLSKPKDMGILKLKEYINLMKRSGGPYTRESIDLQIKYAFPLTTFVVVLLSIPLASNPKKSGIAVSFATGILITLLYFVLFRVLQSAGYSEKIPAFISEWGINILFFIVGLITMLKASK